MAADASGTPEYTNQHYRLAKKQNLHSYTVLCVLTIVVKVGLNDVYCPEHSLAIDMGNNVARGRIWAPVFFAFEPRAEYSILVGGRFRRLLLLPFV